jgi:hypothetical protein
MTVLRDYHFSFLGPAGGHEWNAIKPASTHETTSWLQLPHRTGGLADAVNWALVFRYAGVDHYGAAPCYHRFPVELALCDADGAPKWREAFAFDLRELTPALHFAPTESFLVTNLTTGVYAVGIGILDPRTSEPGVRLHSAGENAHDRIAVGAIDVRDPWLDDRDGDGLPDEWEFLYFGGFTNAMPTDDPNQVHYSNWEHYVSGTDPTYRDLFLRSTEPLGNGNAPAPVDRDEPGLLRAKGLPLPVPQWGHDRKRFTGTAFSVEILDATRPRRPSTAPWWISLMRRGCRCVDSARPTTPTSATAEGFDF